MCKYVFHLCVRMTNQREFSKCVSVTNPSNGAVLGTVPDMNAADAEAAVEKAYEAFQLWKKTTAKVYFKIKYNI